MKNAKSRSCRSQMFFKIGVLKRQKESPGVVLQKGCLAVCNLTKKESPVQLFPVNFCKILKKTTVEPP